MEYGSPAGLARHVLSDSAPGRILVTGAQTGPVQHELMQSGADASAFAWSLPDLSGRDTADPRSGPAPSMPFADAHFDTLICICRPQWTGAPSVRLALTELHRICRRKLYLCIMAEFPGQLRRSEQARSWWENVAFECGFRKHPRYYAATPYDSLEAEQGDFAILLEKIPGPLLTKHSLESLQEDRELHMDMSRETGRRSDAHMVRYQLAADFLRDGDVVLDAACGMGYGSYILACDGKAARVTGADIDESGIAYAEALFTGSVPEGRLAFALSDAQDLQSIADNSIDLFVSFETLEHVPDPVRLIAEAQRVLRPSGRFIASVPNLWVNEEGIDPNPHHLHVYDWQRFRSEIAHGFLLEAAYAQTAGGGMKLGDHPRSLQRFDPDEPFSGEAEWFIIVGMKSPAGRADVPYEERAYRASGEPPNTIAFSRDYENPWLARSLISMGWRLSNRRRLRQLADQVLDESTPGSADAGAAICVLAYLLLEGECDDRQQAVSHMSARIEQHLTQQDVNPHSLRWRVSLTYVMGLLWQSVGERTNALRAFETCAGFDATLYSPLLASKTVEACWRAGCLATLAGNPEQARQFWTRGILLAEQAAQGTWKPIYGDIDNPIDFGLREIHRVIESAGLCSEALHRSRRGLGLPERASLTTVPGRSEELFDGGSAQQTSTQLDPSVYRRLQSAVEQDPMSLRKVMRVTYLIAFIVSPNSLRRLLNRMSQFAARFLTTKVGSDSGQA